MLSEGEGLGAGVGIDVAKNGLDQRGVLGRGQSQSGSVGRGIPDQPACPAGLDLDEVLRLAQRLQAGPQFRLTDLAVEDVLDAQAEHIHQEPGAAEHPGRQPARDQDSADAGFEQVRRHEAMDNRPLCRHSNAPGQTGRRALCLPLRGHRRLPAGGLRRQLALALRGIGHGGISTFVRPVRFKPLPRDRTRSCPTEKQDS